MRTFFEELLARLRGIEIHGPIECLGSKCTGHPRKNFPLDLDRFLPLDSAAQEMDRPARQIE